MMKILQHAIDTASHIITFQGLEMDRTRVYIRPVGGASNELQGWLILDASGREIHSVADRYTVNISQLEATLRSI